MNDPTYPLQLLLLLLPSTHPAHPADISSHLQTITISHPHALRGKSWRGRALAHTQEEILRLDVCVYDAAHRVEKVESSQTVTGN